MLPHLVLSWCINTVSVLATAGSTRPNSASVRNSQIQLTLTALPLSMVLNPKSPIKASLSPIIAFPAASFISAKRALSFAVHSDADGTVSLSACSEAISATGPIPLRF